MRVFFRLCSFLYIADILAFRSKTKEILMYKKCTFYTYAYKEKYRLYGKKYDKIFIRCGIHSSTSVNPTRATSFSYDIDEVAFLYVQNFKKDK